MQIFVVLEIFFLVRALSLRFDYYEEFMTPFQELVFCVEWLFRNENQTDVQLASINSNTQGTKSMFELANVRIIESCHKNSGRTSNGRKTRESAFLHFFQA